METPVKIDLSALADGRLHLIAFCGDRFVYITEDPDGSSYGLFDTLASKFPLLVRRMLEEQRVGGELTGQLKADGRL
jgi:hypothetical protein